jgi:hypothetical protein
MKKKIYLFKKIDGLSYLDSFLTIYKTYEFNYNQKNYFPYHFINYIKLGEYPLKEKEIKEYFISLEKWRNQKINEILNIYFLFLIYKNKK